MCFGMIRLLVGTLALGTAISASARGSDAEMLPDYPLEILNIKPVGECGMEASNRVFRAYPRLRYNIRAAVIGGRYPYAFRLTEAPWGMTVDASTGEIDWPDPRASAEVTLEVTDSAGAKIATSWTIRVTKEKVLFLDAVNGKPVSEGGTGTLENPFRSISDFYPDDEKTGLRTSNYTDWMVYFRAGTYRLDGFKSGWGGAESKQWMNFRDQHPNIFLAYPGERPTIDCESKYSFKVYPQPGFWIEGLRFRGLRNHKYALEIEAGGKHCTVRKIDFEGLGPTTGHNNQSFVRVLIGDAALERLVIQDCRFHDLDHGSGIKLYAIDRALIEGNTFTDFKDPGCNGANLDGAVAMKVCVRRCVFRGNVITGFAGGRAISCLFSQPYRGRMYAEVRENEVCYNLVKDLNGTVAVSIYGHKSPGPFHVYRNTIVGQVVIHRAAEGSGPFVVCRNIFVRDAGSRDVIQADAMGTAQLEIEDNRVLRRSELDRAFVPRDRSLRREYGHRPVKTRAATR